MTNVMIWRQILVKLGDPGFGPKMVRFTGYELFFCIGISKNVHFRELSGKKVQKKFLTISGSQSAQNRSKKWAYWKKLLGPAKSVGYNEHPEVVGAIQKSRGFELILQLFQSDQIRVRDHVRGAGNRWHLRCNYFYDWYLNFTFYSKLDFQF